MKILAIDFSSSLRSVALAERADDRIQLLGRAEERHGQSTHAFAMIDELLSEARIDRQAIDCLAIGLGPGSYAGIRVSLAIAQGWQLAAGVQTIGVSSIECLAEAARVNGHRGVTSFIVDAQRGEFYLAEYELTDTGFTETSGLAIVGRDAVERKISDGGVVCGPDISGAFEQARDLYPDAAILADVATREPVFVSADRLTPIYLRATNFVKAPKPKRVY